MWKKNTTKLTWNLGKCLRFAIEVLGVFWKSMLKVSGLCQYKTPYCSWYRNPGITTLGCIDLVNNGDKLPTSTGDRRISEPSTISHEALG